jgi:predicted nucleic acid-binding protein
VRRHVVLDTGVLGLVTHPSKKLEPRDCKEWLETLLHKGASVYVPEIADYELRRELLRLDMSRAVARLDSLKSVIGYLPITTAAMMKAAEFWARAVFTMLSQVVSGFSRTCGRSA